MIKPHCFERSWIIEKSKQLGGADPTLLEKAIFAFELLGNLKLNGLIFVFKGGTSMLLLLEHFHRLSIDVDIICNMEERRQNEIFSRVIDLSLFKRWTEDLRTPSGIPKKHFKFFYKSQINRREDYVLLDVLNGKNPYPTVYKTTLALPFFQINEKIDVTVPSVESLIGDKLTAFAPHTIGIPFNTKRSMQLIKQLFDLAELFKYATDLQEISMSYQIFTKIENYYRRTNFKNTDVLHDTLDVCYLISQIDLKGSIENETTKIIRRGIRQLESHLLDTSFNLAQAKIAASRIALLSVLLMEQPEMELHNLFYNQNKIEMIRRVIIEGEWSLLNRLKGFLPEAFYYWHLASKFLTHIKK